MPPQEPIRAAGVIILHEEAAGVRMLLLRNRKHGDWGLPKGHLDPGEDDYTGAKRELREETGIEQFKLEAGFRHVVKYRVPSGREAGQWKVVTYFLGSVREAQVAISDEHDELVWASDKQAAQLLRHPNLKTLAREAFGFWAARTP